MTDTPLFLRLKAAQIEHRVDEKEAAFDRALEDQEEYYRELSNQIF